MPEMTLHFEATSGTDTAAAAAALENELKNISGVESAQTKPQVFQSVGPAEILSTIQIATQIAQSTTAFVGALTALYTAWETIKTKFPGLHPPKVEVGLKQIPLDQLTEEHRAELAAQ